MGRVCGVPGCPEIAVDRRHCEQHKREHERAKVDLRSDAGKRSQAWYRTKRWQRRRAQQLAEQPYCQSDMHAGQYVTANTADHIEPHRGDSRKFWGGKLQSLCSHCHSSGKQRVEAKALSAV